MLLSMTGYGSSSASNQDFDFSVEIKSVNNKYLDIQMKNPSYLNILEEDIKNLIKSKIARGRVDVFIKEQKKASTATNVIANIDLAKNVYNEYKHIQDELGLSGEISLSDIIKSPDILTFQSKEIETDELRDFLLNIVKDALDKIYSMRIREGKELELDLLGNIDKLEEIVSQISIRTPFVTKEYKLKIEERLESLCGTLTDIDRDNVLAELAMFAVKSDINEEIKRLNSHIAQFRENVNNGNVVGRKLDFISQEMNRETNTIGSKTQDIEIANLVIQSKSIIDKLKEQVQNVE